MDKINIIGLNSIGGLVAYSDSSVVQNINVKNVNITGGNSISGLVAQLGSSSISKIKMDNVLINSKDRFVGGLVSRNNSSSISSVKLTNIKVISAGGYTVGLVGTSHNYDTENIIYISGVYLSGKISGDAYSNRMIGMLSNTTLNLLV